MSLHGLRAAITQALDPLDLTVYDHVPARIVVPAGIVLPGLPYLAGGDTYGTFEVRHTVSLVAKAGPNQAVTKQLDDLIEDALVALGDAGHDVAEVSPPYAYESSTATFLAVDLTLITHHRI